MEDSDVAFWCVMAGAVAAVIFLAYFNGMIS